MRSKKILLRKIALGLSHGGFFYTPTPPPESALSVQEANFIREYVGSGSCPFVGRGSLFFTGGGFFFSSL
jgi:hypothetical protein